MRKHVNQVEFARQPSEIFPILHTPSAIRQWWGAARVIVNPHAGGTWTAAWGQSEDDPDYITTATISAIEAPRCLKLSDFDYFSKGGNPPFDMSGITTEFILEQTAQGCALTVIQDGFPDDHAADDYFSACAQGWDDTLQSMSKFVAGMP